MWVLDGVPDWGGVKKYESWLLGPGLDLILFKVYLGGPVAPSCTLNKIKSSSSCLQLELVLFITFVPESKSCPRQPHENPN